MSEAGLPVFAFTGNFVEFSCKGKSPPGRIALRRRGIMSLERPDAGGESCRSEILSCDFRRWKGDRMESAGTIKNLLQMGIMEQR